MTGTALATDIRGVSSAVRHCPMIAHHRSREQFALPVLPRSGTLAALIKDI